MAKFHRALPLALAFKLLVMPCAFAQPKPAAPPPSFEVATIKLTPPSQKGDGSWSPPGIGQFWAKALTLKYLIHLAYNIDLNQIAGKQPWLDSEYFDVSAKPEEGIALSRAELQPRLQNLLETRFHLVTHYETRMNPGYALVVAKGAAASSRQPMEPSSPGFASTSARAISKASTGPWIFLPPCCSKPPAAPLPTRLRSPAAMM